MSHRADNVSPDGVPDRRGLPGSDGEHRLQERFDTVDRADRFYASAMQETLTDRMRSFVRDRRMAVIGTADGSLEPSVAPLFGDPGPVRVIDDATLAWANAAGHGEVGPARDVRENPHVTVTMIDWWDSTVGLHVNGSAAVAETAPVDDPGTAGVDTEWIVLSIEEAYIHCAKHIPRLRLVEPATSAGAGNGRSAERGRHDRVTDRIREFLTTRNLFFLGTVDAGGETDVSPRLGPTGIVTVLDDSSVAWPEFRGNGIHASLGNVMETGSATLTFVDWWGSDTCVRVSGRAHLRDAVTGATGPTDSEKTKTWVVLDVDSVAVDHEAGLPTLAIEEFDPPWGTDDEQAKKVGFFTE